MLTIGEFSRLTHLSVRTLRRYHDAGLLVPMSVDEATAYRYYDVAQIPTAQVIHRLRELDVPLPEVQEILRSPDPDARAALVSGHVRRLELELERKRAAVVSLRRLLDPEPAPVDVRLRAVPATTAAAVADDVDLDDALFQTGHGHAVVYLPTARPPRSGRVHPVTLPAVELAVAAHIGAHDDIDVTYGELGAWVVDNALRVAGPVRETYLVGPRDTDDPAPWRTEIGWPVFRLSTASVTGGRAALPPVDR